MTKLTIKESGGANIISIPKTILKTLNLQAGSSLDLAIEDNKIVLRPLADEPTLEELLAGSQKEKLKLTDEDRQWIHAASVGKEL